MELGISCFWSAIPKLLRLSPQRAAAGMPYAVQRKFQLVIMHSDTRAGSAIASATLDQCLK